MYQHIIGGKRASLILAKWRRNEFCSASSRAFAATHGRQGQVPVNDAISTPDAARLGIDVGLDVATRSARTPRSAATRSIDRMGQSLLQIVAPRAGDARRSRCAANHNPRRRAGSSSAGAAGSSSQISTVTSSRCGAPISKSWNPMSASTSSESSRMLGSTATFSVIGHQAVELRSAFVAHDCPSPGIGRRAPAPEALPAVDRQHLAGHRVAAIR